MFRVVNWEKASDEEMIAGLTAEEAAKKRLELAGYAYEFRMVGEYLTLFLSERRATLSAPAGRLLPAQTATYKDRHSAEQQLCEWIIDAPLSGPYIVVTDREYEEAQRHMAADDDDAIERRA